MQPSSERKPETGRRGRLHEIIFEADTAAGKTFDVALLLAIVLSVIAVCLESVAAYKQRHGSTLLVLEWVFTGLFTLEYILRLIAVRSPLRYATSFFGVVDLLAILPSYLTAVVPGAQSLLVIRVFRMLRVFRVMKLGRFVGQAEILVTALKASSHKIIVFLVAVLSLVVSMGATMYLIEGPASGFDSIPRGMYWAVVTVTTVGYGDISPRTPLGQMVAALLMIVGYGILAVPTGIVSVEIAAASMKVSTQACPNCSKGGHDPDATFCKFCGSAL